MQPRLLTKKQAAEYLGVCTATLDKCDAVRPVNIVKSGSKKMFDRIAIDQWLDKLSGIEANSNLSPLEIWVEEHGASNA